jgi:serine/threonine protein phosphatase 1
MTKFFVVGDVHGEYNMLVELLKSWNPETHRLVFLGDLIDRGPKSKEVVELAIKMQVEYGAIILKGNHEEMFMSWLDTPQYERDLYYPQGGRETLRSFFGWDISQHYDTLNLAKLTRRDCKHIIDFINTLPQYHETDEHIFVHAGVDLSLDDWKETKESHFTWIRGAFHNGVNNTGKTIIFGHTPTMQLHKDGSHDVWVSPCSTKIGIDGGAVFDGLLHGLEINPDKYISYSVAKDLTKRSSES